MITYYLLYADTFEEGMAVAMSVGWADGQRLTPPPGGNLIVVQAYSGLDLYGPPDERGYRELESEAKLGASLTSRSSRV